MYIVDKVHNEIKKVEEKTFTDLGFKERQNLQEWIAKEPNVFGDDDPLLIIQKEFDGFSDTKERLDLLALDKKGHLVIIENKLDDSGKDVVWQSIKYASYCSQLDTNGIIDIYQKYIGSSSNAKEKILEFLEKDEDETLSLNTGNTQRIFMVAGNFQKEVTSAVLWLREFGIDVSCFEVTPYADKDNIYIDFDQVIPPKNAKDYMIRLASKKQEEVQAKEINNQRGKALNSFWKDFIEYSQKNDGIHASSAGTPDNWLGKSLKGVNGGNINIVANKDNCRVEAFFNTGNKDRNKALFDFFISHKKEIEQKIPNLDWQRMDDKITSRICIMETYSYLNESEREKEFQFFLGTSKLMLDVFSEVAKKLPKDL